MCNQDFRPRKSRLGPDPGLRSHEERTPVERDVRLSDGSTEPARSRDQPVPAPACREPRRLVCVGAGGVRCCDRAQRADPVERRLQRLPLVPRDGPRMLRGRRGGRRDEPAIRQHQSRSRGTSRRRLDLHGRSAGDEWPWWLADDRLPDARRPPVLRRNLLPEAELLEPDGGDRRRVGQPARRCASERRGVGRCHQAHRVDRAGRRSARQRCAQSGGPTTRRIVRRNVGRLRRGSEVPVDDEPRPGVAGLRARPSGRCEDNRHHITRRDGERWNVRPHRRWLRPLLGRREVAGASLREDALRPGVADPCLPARLPRLR